MDKNMNHPLVTVLMPVYNGQQYLKEAIDSILTQSFTNFELLIINDGSTDNSLQIIQSYNDARIRLVKNEKNLGLIETLNKGIRLAEGEYIARMDADDISHIDRLKEQVHFLDHNPAITLVATRLVLINEKDEEIGVWSDDFEALTIEQIEKMLPKINCLGHPTVMMRKKIVQHYGYNKKFEKSEDWGLWLNLLSEGHILAKLNMVLLRYRIHTESTTVKANKEGVRKKIILFKRAYLIDKVLKWRLKGTDYQVLFSFFTDLLKYYFPLIYKLITNLYSTNPLLFIRQFRLIRKQLLLPAGSASHIFFFPYYHVGGAESVHASILETVSDKAPIVLITNVSNDLGFLPAFKKSARVFNIEQLLIWKFTKNWLIKKINLMCENEKQVILFGCNSHFFYNTISKTPAHTKIVDLIHAFNHKHEDGAEKWSLPVVPKLMNRIVINNKTKNDLIELYRLKNIPSHFISRVVCITNFVDKEEVIKKEFSENLNVLFVGRGTPEKRVHLIAQAARLLNQKNSKISFHFIGDVEKSIPSEDLPFCNLHGVVTDRRLMKDLYSKAHILVITSSREGFPMVIMESMMNGLVPISTNVGGISEHVHDNENGMLINATEENEIVEELIKKISYFTDNKNEFIRISENAHAYALANFGKNNFEESYKRILSN